LDYIITGGWSEKAAAEAKRLGSKVNVVFSTKNSSHDGSLPDLTEWKFSDDAEFIYYCDNETVHGVELPTNFVDQLALLKKPIICDMSSNILSRPFDVSKYACIFAGAQKNIGPSGVTIVIVRKDLIRDTNHCPTRITPLMMDYKTFADNNSLYNTPPTFPIYVAGLVFEYLLELGGISHQDKLVQEKANHLYQLIEQNPNLHCPVKKEYRSRMNICFRICKDSKPNEDLEKLFVKKAELKGLVQLKGHRSVGGIRASCYNAMPLEGVMALVDFIKEFLNTI
jgi:phosphoserine aminotransferase